MSSESSRIYYFFAYLLYVIAKDTGETKTDVAVTTNTGICLLLINKIAQTDTSDVTNNYYQYQEYDPAYYPVIPNYPYYPYFPEGVPPVMYSIPPPMIPPQQNESYDAGRSDSSSANVPPPENPSVIQQPYYPYLVQYEYYDGPYDYENATNPLNTSPTSRRYSFENNKSTPRVKPSTPSSRPIKKCNYFYFVIFIIV